MKTAINVLMALAIGIAALSPATAAGRTTWLGAFAHVPTAYNMSPPVSALGRDGTPRMVPPGYAPLPPYPAGTSVREVVRLSVAGRAIRLTLSNEFSDKPLHIGEVHVALVGEDGAIVPGSDHTITFSGQPGIVIPPGAPWLSDPLDWPLPALSRLAVTIFYPDETTPPAHTLYALNGWAAPANQTASRALTGAVLARSGNHLSRIDVAAEGGRTVVCLGDSITEGVASTVGAFRGWPDRLAERLGAARRGWSVVNAGIGSNRLLHDTPSVGALARFDRDVLSVPGVAKVILLLGINDIQYSRRNPAEAVSADEIKAALSQLAARAHAAGIEVIAGTITPFGESSSYSPEGEQMRTQVNDWIRNSRSFDGVIDFDRALRDPAQPSRLVERADSGGHLHPNDTGYAMIADAIDLRLFAP